MINGCISEPRGATAGNSWMGRHNGTADDDGELVAASYPAELLINPNENDERGRRGL